MKPSNFFRSCLLLFVLLAFGLAKSALADSGIWTPTGSLLVGRGDHTATLLANGQVLVIGGNNIAGDLASTELYNPTSGVWTNTGALTESRYAHTATLLANGKVLVAGGYGGPGGYLASTELYDPASGLWTNTGTLNAYRYYHTATRLANGKVLVAGGIDGSGFVATAELYDPASGLWTYTTPLTLARRGHTATLLADGKVLVVGGYNYSGKLAGAEVYDPATGVWAYAGALNVARSDHTATLLSNGNVLVVGGDGYSGFLASTELYDPASGLWTNTGALTEARFYHTTTLLANGNVLVAGGLVPPGIHTANAELYDPASGLWTSAGVMAEKRIKHTATLLVNGQALITGGYSGSNGYLASAELYGAPQPLDQTITITTNAPASAKAGDVFTVSANGSSGLAVSYSSSGACTNVGATFTMVSGTGACTVYYDQSGDATYNPAPQLTEVVDDANDPPTALHLSSASVAGNMPVGTIVGTFSSVDADSGDTFTYSLVSGTGGEDNSSFTIVGDQLQTTAMFDATIKNSYSIRVRTTDNGGGNLAFEQTFTITVTANNETPSLVAPANSAQLLNNRPVFDWTDVPGAVSYRIQIYRSNNFAKSAKIVNTTTALSTYSPPTDLPENTTLYWRVQMNTSTGTGPWSTIWIFTTANPPSVPTLLSPRNNAKNLSIYPMLDWTDSLLPVGTSFQNYELQLSVNPTFSSPIEVHITGGVGSSSVLLNLRGIYLQIATKYYWRVRAFNTLGEYSSWSTVFNFTTIK